MLTYTELIKRETLEERYNYLRLDGEVGCVTFGGSRWLNQAFYTSREWRDVRQQVQFRDQGCDLGVEDWPIFHRPIVHHLNVLTESDIRNRSSKLFDLENLITTTHATHNAIHYGDVRQLPTPWVERFEGDTKEW